MRYQTQLNNYCNPALEPINASKFIERIDIDDFLKDIVLPFRDNASKFRVIDYIRILIFKELKGIKTLKKTLEHLKKSQYDLKRLQIESIPPHYNFSHFIHYRLGKDVYDEIINRIRDLKHDNQCFIQDSIPEHKQRKRNTFTVNKKHRRQLTQFVKKYLISNIKNHEVINQSYSNKDIWTMVLHMICGNVHSAHSYGESERISDEGDYKREKVATGRTILNRIRQMFDTEEDIQKFQFEMLKKTITLLRQEHPDWFNRRTFNLAIDENSVPTWEKISKSPNPTDIINDAHYEQKGTTFFREYLVCSIIIHGYRFTIGFIPINRFTKSNIHIQVEKLILMAKSIIPINIVTLDREFETLGVL